MKKLLMFLGAAVFALTGCGSDSFRIDTVKNPPEFFMNIDSTNGYLELKTGQTVDALETVGLVSARLERAIGTPICSYTSGQLRRMIQTNELDGISSNDRMARSGGKSLTVYSDKAEYTNNEVELHVTTNMKIDENSRIISVPGTYYIDYDMYNMCENEMGGNYVKDTAAGKYVRSLGMSRRIQVVLVDGQ